jgi:hypothetical protein
MDNLPTSEVYLLTNILLQAHVRGWPRGRTISYMIRCMADQPGRSPSEIWAHATHIYDHMRPMVLKQESAAPMTEQQLNDMIALRDCVDVLNY